MKERINQPNKPPLSRINPNKKVQVLLCIKMFCYHLLLQPTFTYIVVFIIKFTIVFLGDQNYDSFF